MNKWTLRLAGVIWDNSGADQYYESARWGKLLHDVWIEWKCFVCGTGPMLEWGCVADHSWGMRKQSIGTVSQTRYLSSGITQWRDAQKRFWKWSVVKPVGSALFGLECSVSQLPLSFKSHRDNASKQIKSRWSSEQATSWFDPGMQESLRTDPTGEVSLPSWGWGLI